MPTIPITRLDLPSLMSNQIKQNLQPFILEPAANHTKVVPVCKVVWLCSQQSYSKLIRKLLNSFNACSLKYGEASEVLICFVYLFVFIKRLNLSLHALILYSC